MNEIIPDFLLEMQARGCAAADPSAIIADDRRHRYQLEGDRKGLMVGVYQLRIDADGAVGWFRSHRAGKTFSFTSRAKKEWSDAEKSAWKARADASRKEQAARIKMERDAAADKAARIWKRADKNGHSDYLDRKKSGAHGARFLRGSLIIPIYIGGKITSLQFISGTGEKLFVKGSELSGGYFPMAAKGDDLSRIVICEGFATGDAVRRATNLPVVVAFNAGNLKPVAMAMRKKYPDAHLIFAADNDQWTFDERKRPSGIRRDEIPGDDPRWLVWRSEGVLLNPGIINAQNAAVAIGGASVIWPEIPASDAAKRTDFNDLALSDGLDTVKEQILRVFTPKPVEEVAHPQQEYGGRPEDYSAEPNFGYDGYEQTSEPPVTRYKVDFPFKILGHNDGHYYFLPRASGQIFSSSATGLANMANLFRLAPLEYWNDNFNQDGKMNSRKVAEFVANALIAECHEIGVFRPHHVRGLGAWIDGKQQVLHCGNELIVNGESIRPHEFKSAFVYPMREAIIRIDVPPLPNRDAVKLRDICKSLSWDSPLSGELLAGWCVIAPVCAALKWRPHIWITGESQSGKTTVLEKIVVPIVGAWALRVDGGTTEPALRQILGVDGRPIIYDEAEPDTQRDRVIMEQVLQLVRRASSGGNVIKGGQNGEAIQYNVRSAFCFSGINPAIKHRADESRISQLVIKRANFEGADEYYQELSKKIRQVITPEFCAGLLARTVANLPTILHNADVFSDAAAEVLCDRRAADQIGSMLAGLFLLTSTKRIDLDAAVDWIRRNEWNQHTAVAEDSDPQRLITYISTSAVRYRGGDVTIGTLIAKALGAQGSFYENDISDDEAGRFLRDMGIWVKNDGVLFANKAPPLERILKDTAWVSWARPLMDIPGSVRVDPVKFSTGLKQRAVLVPLEAFGL